jgi:hypothetical protein
MPFARVSLPGELQSPGSVPPVVELKNRTVILQISVEDADGYTSAVGRIMKAEILG